jgi:hypothetical protein
MVMPGDHVEMVCDLVHDVAAEVGSRFTLREGGKTGQFLTSVFSCWICPHLVCNSWYWYHHQNLVLGSAEVKETAEALIQLHHLYLQPAPRTKSRQTDICRVQHYSLHFYLVEDVFIRHNLELCSRVCESENDRLATEDRTSETRTTSAKFKYIFF